jgi:hypothetical protein
MNTGFSKFFPLVRSRGHRIHCTMSKTPLFPLLLATLLGPGSPGWGAESAARDEILRRIAEAPAHPRLFWTAKDENSVREKAKSQGELGTAWEAVRLTADHMLTQPPVVYRKDGRRLLGRSREALSRMMHLGFAFRITGDKRYVERSIAEIKAMAAMPDWNPSHFLDTAEMTMAIAVGYDWLYHELSPEIRALCREAISSKGLGPYLKPGSSHGWERGRNNWNQVCHAGMVAGALALLEENPQQVAEVVSRALAGLPYSMKVYDPDGTYPEGPGYWNYGTSFNVLLIEMLKSALGTDFGLTQSPGFLKSADFMLYIMGPTRRTFNFSDCGTGTSFSPAMIWFAAQTGRPELLWFERELLARDLAAVRDSNGRRQGDRYFPLILVWANDGLERREPKTLHWLGQGQNPLAVLRSSWTDPNAVYLAIKAGTPSASHGHMDIGSFILDSDGVRWSLDLGAEDYNRLEQRGIDLWNGRQGAQRWQIFRYHNRGHSTLLVNDSEQVVTSKATIPEFSADPQNAFAVVDLSATYAGQLASATRRFQLLPDRSVSIEDRLTGGAERATVRWGMVTDAALKSDGAKGAWLEKDGKRLRLEIAAPGNPELQSWSANPPPREFDAPNPGVSVVGFNVPLAAAETVTLKVSLRPGSAGSR